MLSVMYYVKQGSSESVELSLNCVICSLCVVCVHMSTYICVVCSHFNMFSAVAKVSALLFLML